jgi:hypothetical protein
VTVFYFTTRPLPGPSYTTPVDAAAPGPEDRYCAAAPVAKIEPLEPVPSRRRYGADMSLNCCSCIRPLIPSLR